MKRIISRKKFSLDGNQDPLFRDGSWREQLEWFEREGFSLIFGLYFTLFPQNRAKYQRVITPLRELVDVENDLKNMGRLEFGNRRQIETLQAWEYSQLLNNLSNEKKADWYSSEDEYLYYGYLDSLAKESRTKTA